MPPSAHPSLIVSAAIAVLVVWRLYSRIRRMVGRQQLAPVRPWLTACLLPLIFALLLLTSLAHPANLAALAAGAALGAILGIAGLRLTKFEVTPSGLFYTPNAHLGIGLSLLLAVRIGFRVVELYFSAPQPGAAPTQFVYSPLTLAIFGTLAAYYVAYAIGLLRWRSRSAAALALPVQEAA